MKYTLTIDTDYPCSICNGKGNKSEQPFGLVLRCSSCGGTGYANELDRYAQKLTKGSNK